MAVLVAGEVGLVVCTMVSACGKPPNDCEPKSVRWSIIRCGKEMCQRLLGLAWATEVWREQHRKLALKIGQHRAPRIEGVLVVGVMPFAYQRIRCCPIHLLSQGVTVRLMSDATVDERKAFTALLGKLNRMGLIPPGNPERRKLVWRLK